MIKQSQRPVVTECYPTKTRVKEELIKSSRFSSTATKDTQLDHYSSSSSDSKQTTYELPKLSGYNYPCTVGNASTQSTSRGLWMRSGRERKSWRAKS